MPPCPPACEGDAGAGAGTMAGGSGSYVMLWNVCWGEEHRTHQRRPRPPSDWCVHVTSPAEKGEREGEGGACARLGTMKNRSLPAHRETEYSTLTTSSAMKWEEQGHTGCYPIRACMPTAKQEAAQADRHTDRQTDRRACARAHTLRLGRGEVRPAFPRVARGEKGAARV